MPHVPYPVGDAATKDFVWSMVTRSKGFGNNWSTILSSGTSEKAVCASTRGLVVRGGRYKLGDSWRWPVKPYSRTASVVSCIGGPENLGNSPIPANCTIFRDRTGMPYAMPLNPMQILAPSGGVEVPGLVESGLPVLSSNTRNRLITECMVKIGDRKVNYGEALGEGRKTLSHLAQTSSTVIKALLALRRGNFGQMLKLLGLSRRKVLTGKSAAEKWLEVQYAWMPLLSDIYDTGKLLSDGMARKSQNITAVRVLSESAVFTRKTSWCELVGSAKVQHRCVLHYRLSNQTTDTLSRLGLINPAEVAWALVPYSFVVDWFLPIGNVLEAYTTTVGLTFIDGCISSLASVDGSGTHENAGSGLYYLTGSRFQWSASHSGFQRTVVTAPLALPYVKSPFSSKHIVSALALLRQLRR